MEASSATGNFSPKRKRSTVGVRKVVLVLVEDEGMALEKPVRELLLVVLLGGWW